MVDPCEEFSLAQYLEAAGQGRGGNRRPRTAGSVCRRHAALPEGSAAGNLPRAAGRLGTPPPAGRRSPSTTPTDWLHERLAAVDPVAAARLHPNDARRLIRAIEVFEKTGRPISELQQQFEMGRPAAECRVFVLDWPREELCRSNRPTGRADVRRRTGRRSPRACWPARDPLSRTARQAVGYREVIEHLEGRRSLAETVELVQQHTRQLAKRQCTWFRSLSECRFVAVAGQIDAARNGGHDCGGLTFLGTPLRSAARLAANYLYHGAGESPEPCLLEMMIAGQGLGDSLFAHHGERYTVGQ